MEGAIWANLGMVNPWLDREILGCVDKTTNGVAVGQLKPTIWRNSYTQDTLLGVMAYTQEACPQPYTLRVQLGRPEPHQYLNT